MVLMGKIECDFVPRDVPGRDGTACQNPIPAHGKMSKYRPGPSRGKILSLSRVPSSRGARKSCPVGKPSSILKQMYKIIFLNFSIFLEST